MEYKGIKLTLDMDTKEMESAISRVANSTKVFDNDIRKLKQNLKFDPTNLRTYNVMVETLTKKINDTSNAADFLRDYLNKALDTGKILEYSSEYVNLSNVITQLENNLKTTEKDIQNLTNDWKENGRVSKDTLNNINKGLKDVGDESENSDSKISIFLENLKANLATKAITAGLEFIKDSLKSIVDLIVKAAKAYANLMKQGIEYDALIQGYTTTLSAYLGDTDVASKFVKDVRQIGIEFGFANDRLLEMAQTLVVSGVSVDDTKRTIEGVVSALSVFGKGNAELSRVSTNLLQIQTNGRATARDLREFANAGIPIYKMLADYSDEFTGDFKATEVELEDILGAFNYAMQDENNILSKAGEIRQQTFNGQLDALQGRWQEFLGNMALDTTGTLTTEILPAANDFLSSLLKAFQGDENGENGGMPAVAKAFGEGLGDLIATISDSGVLEQFLNGATMIMNAIGRAFDPETAAGKRNLEALNRLLDSALNILVNFITSDEILSRFVAAGFEIGKAIVGAIWDEIVSEFGEYWNNAFSGGWNDVSELPGYQSGGYGALQSGGYNMTSNLTINVNSNQAITENEVRGWARIINEELGNQI